MFIYRDSDDDDEEFDVQQAKDVAPIALSTKTEKMLDNALRQYQRDGYFEKYFIRDNESIGSGGFGTVFKAKYSPIGPLSEPSEYFAIKKILLKLESLQDAIREYEFYNQFTLTTTGIASPKEFWFEKEIEYNIYSMYIRMDLCSANMRDGIYLLRAVYGDGSKVANRQLAILYLMMFEEVLTSFVGLQEFFIPPLIHRDFKPENVLFSKNGMKLCDFGCATAHELEPSDAQASTSDSQIPLHSLGIGTDLYQAPEVKEVDTTQVGEYNWKVDMYALGLTLLEMFCETPPVVEELKKLFADVVERRIVPEELSRLWPKIAEIILNLTQKDAKLRKSANETRVELYMFFSELIKDVRHGNMRKQIYGATTEFQTIVDDWVVSLKDN